MKEYKNGTVKFDIQELNEIAIYAGEAEKYFQGMGCPGMAKRAKEFCDMLHDICEKHGLYDNLED